MLIDEESHYATKRHCTAIAGTEETLGAIVESLTQAKVPLGLSSEAINVLQLA
jgi:hypothetical protein